MYDKRQWKSPSFLLNKLTTYTRKKLIKLHPCFAPDAGFFFFFFGKKQQGIGRKKKNRKCIGTSGEQQQKKKIKIYKKKM